MVTATRSNHLVLPLFLGLRPSAPLLSEMLKGLSHSNLYDENSSVLARRHTACRHAGEQLSDH